MQFETIEVSVEGNVGLLGMNRPHIRNAINTVMLRELTQAMQQLNSDPEVRAIVLYGNGPTFCAGFDLKESQQRKTQGLGPWRERLEEDFHFMAQFWDSKKPTIAAVQGHCIAGGFELALACDVTIASQDAMFGIPEAKFGSGAIFLLLPWVAGPKVAKEVILSGMEGIDAERAARVGIANRVVPAGEHLEAAKAYARSVAACSPLAVLHMKKAINAGMEMAGMRQAMLAALETGIILEVQGGPEQAEFGKISREQGMQAAIAWRNSRGTATP